MSAATPKSGQSRHSSGGTGHASHAEGMPPQEAIIESARDRLRPIFMTASNVFGFFPLVVASGAGLRSIAAWLR